MIPRPLYEIWIGADGQYEKLSACIVIDPYDPNPPTTEELQMAMQEARDNLLQYSTRNKIHAHPGEEANGEETASS